MAQYHEQMTFEDLDGDEGREYREFVEKFKPKKTTDDCYTLENIYEGVKSWACKKYGIDPATIVRPFWPGEDYERYDYPDGCFVLDNPPFSILSKIVRFYMRNRVRFLLFAPGLSTFTAPETGARYLCVGVTITYANGAGVNTSFVTSEGEWRVETCPDLYRIIEKIDKENLKVTKRQVRKLAFPDCVAVAARLNWLAVHGEVFRCRDEDALYLHDLDNCDVFGGCFLLSERAAAERAAAERAAAERVQLSEREKELQKRLGRKP